MEDMNTQILVGTADGLWIVGEDGAGRVEAMAGHTVTALARDGARLWAIVDGRTIVTSADHRQWERAASVEGSEATCLALTPAGLLVGTEQAHLVRLADGRPERVETFESVDGRRDWYTPWGEPADVRSIAGDPAGSATYVNVHVGGVVRSRDGGRSWAPTLDIEVDVHQVLAHPLMPGVVLAAAADGLGVSRDGGDTWEFLTAGLHAHYLRAVAVAGQRVLVTASAGHHGRRAAIYRKPLDGAGEFERCRAGLPQWFGDNVDTACLAASDDLVALGTEDGRVFRSVDGGESWELAAKGLPAIRGVVLG
jgi:hypothetical protein